MPQTLVQFGAGNIGRSFIAQIFATQGWQIIFVDIDPVLIDRLNQAGRYRVIVKSTDQPDQTIWVNQVRAILATNTQAVTQALTSADLAATAVGPRALLKLAPVIAQSLSLRKNSDNTLRPLDIILAENLRNAANILREELKQHCSSQIDLNRDIGLIETSIGKMVPLMRPADLAVDPLWVFAEPYNTLILDRRAFRCPIPAITALSPQNNMTAYVDRKSFIHNLGHAAASYFGFLHHPNQPLLCDVLQNPQILSFTRSAMEESALALTKEYPDEFTLPKLQSHIEDLLHRFLNRALGDTVYRVGRDLYRKLSNEDRLIGALKLCHKHNIPSPTIAKAVLAACRFKATDDSGKMFDSDIQFHEKEASRGIPHILQSVSNLNPANAFDQQIAQSILSQSL